MPVPQSKRELKRGSQTSSLRDTDLDAGLNRLFCRMTYWLTPQMKIKLQLESAQWLSVWYWRGVTGYPLGQKQNTS